MTILAIIGFFLTITQAAISAFEKARANWADGVKKLDADVLQSHSELSKRFSRSAQSGNDLEDHEAERQKANGCMCNFYFWKKCYDGLPWVPTAIIFCVGCYFAVRFWCIKFADLPGWVTQPPEWEIRLLQWMVLASVTILVVALLITWCIHQKMFGYRERIVSQAETARTASGKSATPDDFKPGKTPAEL